MYKHNVASFEAMWKEVERRTGQRFRVTAWLDPGLGLNGETTHWHDPLTRRLYWESSIQIPFFRLTLFSIFSTTYRVHNSEQ
ncbi:hypothetical protein VTK73DRAFT_3155 [Phialemonium thermophilum]|uniref:Uncharacterized protein n=1 Tax=Phialemonium thermophilum TaxID=223376 RepID=A0ABR3VKB4_9PEZI